MRRRDKARGKTARRWRKASKRQNGQKARDRDETLEQLAATSEVLEAISHSTFDLQTVLATLVKSAGRLCQAENVQIFLYDGEFYRLAADNGFSPEYQRYARDHPIRPGRDTLVARTALGIEPVQIPDALADPEYTYGGQKLGGYRTLLGVPLLRDEKCIGVIALTRSKVHPFTDRQIALVTNFAAQAVIAIENTRLLNELRQSLERQTATSEVLGVISSSPGDLAPVFEAMLASAMRICEAKFGNLLLYDGESYHPAHLHNLPAAYREIWEQGPIRPNPELALGRLPHTKQTVQITDLKAEPGYGDPLRIASVEFGGVRTLLAVPMLKENQFVGAIVIYRQEVRPFTDKQIDLVQNFAAQAVIAIENARLLNELRDSLGRQTATSEVLSVISSSRGNLAPVFHAILENATRICEATFGSMLLREGDGFRRAALHNAPQQFEEFNKNVPILKRGMASSVDHAIDTGQVSHTLDAAAEEPNAPIARYAGARTLLDVPMLKGNEAIGILGIYRQEVRPFTDRQIELVKNFAAQAVIAIENARLLNDLNKLNQQLEQRVTDQVGEIERMSRLRRFLPPQVADLIVASGTEKQLESHRREITALFCDLRGFTGFSESSDPEDVMALLGEYHAAIGTIINKYSGTLERYAGDGVMVIFNDPVPVENPALQAVLMALEMRTAIEALMEKWRLLGHDIGFGIGIAHGFATLGTIGFEGRRDYAAIGTVSNVASRLCDEAKPGQILISPRVLLAVDKAVTVEPVGEFTLKGIRRPMMTYNVLEHSPSKPN
jgi:class 3 adenylate cyclase/putative methionine-R-sulfoxide reductase with GAF domain